MALVLSKQEVLSLVKMADLVAAVEAGLIEVARGTAINPNRLRVFVPDGRAMMACMPAYLGGLDLLGAKVVSSSSRPPAPGQPRPMSALVMISDTNGHFLAVMCGTQLGALRTAAASAVAIQRLARPDATRMAIIGCGVQGRAELAGAMAVRALTEVHAFDVSPDAAAAFAEEMGKQGVQVTLQPSADDATFRADIIALATTSESPVVSASAIRPGAHINAVGAHTPNTRELDSDTIARARLFAESRPALLAEAGDFLIPFHEGRIGEAHIIGELGEVAAGMLEGRLSPNDITVFKSTGIAVEDVVAARQIYDQAVADGVGTVIDL